MYWRAACFECRPGCLLSWLSLLPVFLSSFRTGLLLQVRLTPLHFHIISTSPFSIIQTFQATQYEFLNASVDQFKMERIYCLSNVKHCQIQLHVKFIKKLKTQKFERLRFYPVHLEVWATTEEQLLTCFDRTGHGHISGTGCGHSSGTGHGHTSGTGSRK
jgi:hypothetical protein